MESKKQLFLESFQGGAIMSFVNRNDIPKSQPKPKTLLCGVDPISNLRLKHGQVRIERELKSRRLDVAILVGGGVAFITTIALQKFCYELIGEQVLHGWPLKIAGGTLIVFALRKLIRQAWYKGDDTIYEREIQRFTESQ